MLNQHALVRLHLGWGYTRDTLLPLSQLPTEVKVGLFQTVSVHQPVTHVDWNEGWWVLLLMVVVVVVLVGRKQPEAAVYHAVSPMRQQPGTPSTVGDESRESHSDNETTSTTTSVEDDLALPPPLQRRFGIDAGTSFDQALSLQSALDQPPPVVTTHEEEVESLSDGSAEALPAARPPFASPGLRRRKLTPAKSIPFTMDASHHVAQVSIRPSGRNKAEIVRNEAPPAPTKVEAPSKVSAAPLEPLPNTQPDCPPWVEPRREQHQDSTTQVENESTGMPAPKEHNTQFDPVPPQAATLKAATKDPPVSKPNSGGSPKLAHASTLSPRVRRHQNDDPIPSARRSRDDKQPANHVQKEVADIPETGKNKATSEPTAAQRAPTVSTAKTSTAKSEPVRVTTTRITPAKRPHETVESPDLSYVSTLPPNSHARREEEAFQGFSSPPWSDPQPATTRTQFTATVQKESASGSMTAETQEATLTETVPLKPEPATVKPEEAPPAPRITPEEHKTNKRSIDAMASPDLVSTHPRPEEDCPTLTSPQEPKRLAWKDDDDDDMSFVEVVPKPSIRIARQPPARKRRKVASTEPTVVVRPRGRALPDGVTSSLWTFESK